MLAVPQEVSAPDIGDRPIATSELWLEARNLWRYAFTWDQTWSVIGTPNGTPNLA